MEAERVGSAICGSLHKMKLQVEKAVKTHELDTAGLIRRTVIELENALINLTLIIPFAVCPLCEGDERRETYAGCAQRGFMSKFRYERCIPRDVKQARLDVLQRRVRTMSVKQTWQKIIAPAVVSGCVAAGP